MKSGITILALIICANLNAQKVKSYYSHWRDYKNEDLMSQPVDFNYSENAKFYYYVSNDRDNIYINLKVFESDVQSKILRSGLTVWINMDGKKVKKLGILYPAPIQRPEMRHQQPGAQNIPAAGGNPRQKSDRQSVREQPIKLIGFSKSEDDLIPSTRSDDFRGSIVFSQDGKLWYELILPVSKLPVLNDKSGLTRKPFTLGLSYESGLFPAGGRAPGNMGELSSGGPGGGGSGGGRSGGRGSGGGGSRGGGMPGGGMQAGAPRSEMSQYQSTPVIVWVKNITLASD